MLIEDGTLEISLCSDVSNAMPHDWSPSSDVLHLLRPYIVRQGWLDSFGLRKR